MNSIIEKARKLQALSGSSNVHEAALAAAKLQELLFKHNLDMAQVEKPDSDGYDVTTYDLGRGNGTVSWKRALLSVIARTNFCEVVSEPRSTMANIIGERHNVEVVTHLYDYLKAEIIRLCEVELSDPETVIATTRQTWRNNFFLGAVVTIHDRLMEQFNRNKTSTDASTALVSAKEHEVELATRRHFPNTATRAARGYADRGAQAAGKRAARGIGLERPVNAPKNGTLALAS